MTVFHRVPVSILVAGLLLVAVSGAAPAAPPPSARPPVAIVDSADAPPTDGAAVAAAPLPKTAGSAPPEDAPATDMSLRARFHAAVGQVQGKLVRLLAAAPLLLVAAAIVWLAAWLGRVLAQRMHWLRRLRSPNPYMDGLVRGTVRSLVLLAGILVALDLLDATSLVGAVLGSAGVVGLVLGFAFKDIAENYIAGILLSLRRPFSPGDHVQIENREGRVVALTSRATILMTLDGNQLRLPNALVFKSVILNYSHNPKRRFEFSIAIDPSESIRQAQELALAEIAKVEGVLDDPGPSWLVHEYAAGGIVLRFFGWIDQHRSDLGKVRSEAIRLVKSAFARAGVEPPRTVYHVISERAPGEAGKHEPGHRHGERIDTSVNRDIDQQLAAAQRASDDDNLLDGSLLDGSLLDGDGAVSREGG